MTSRPAPALSEDLSFALRLAAAAEQEIMPRFHHSSTRTKTDGTLVTEADTEAERVMRELIASEFPDDGILGEEHGARNADQERVWVLDPIDGTNSFVLGQPVFGTLVGLVRGGEPVLGVIHIPALGETVFAETGGGCWFRRGGGNTEKVHVAPSPDGLHSARVSTTGVYRTDIDPRAERDPIRLGALIQQCPGFRFVGDCMQYALVARGLLDAALDPEMNPWDIAAVVPCIREAGGIVTSARGEAAGLINQPSLLASCHPRLHEDVLDVLAPSSRVSHR